MQNYNTIAILYLIDISCQLLLESMTDIEVYTLAGDKYIIPSVSKVYELIDYLKNIYNFTKISIISDGVILEKTSDVTDINSQLFAVMSKSHLLIRYYYSMNDLQYINIYDTISNKILSKYYCPNGTTKIDAYSHILLYGEWLYVTEINIVDIYDNTRIGMIKFKEKIKVCKIMKEIPIKYILCILEDNSIHIYSINNFNSPIHTYNIMTSDEIRPNLSSIFYFSNSSNKIGYLHEFKPGNFNICLIDLKLDSHIVIKLKTIDYEYHIRRHGNPLDGFFETIDNPWYILSFSRDETMLLAHSSLNIIVYNTSDGSIIYRLDMENIMSVVWHPFEPTLIFLRNEENIFYENNVDYEEGYDYHYNHFRTDNYRNNRDFRDNCYLYKCNIYDTDKQIYKLNNIKYKIIQSYENDCRSMIFSQDGSELLIPCYNAIVIHKTSNFNEIHSCIFSNEPLIIQIRINY